MHGGRVRLVRGVVDSGRRRTSPASSDARKGIGPFESVSPPGCSTCHLATAVAGGSAPRVRKKPNGFVRAFVARDLY